MAYLVYALCMGGGGLLGALAPILIRDAVRNFRRQRKDRARALVRTSTYQATYARDHAEAERSKTK